MSLRRARILFAAGVSSSLLAGLAVAESSSATTSDTVTESSAAISDPVTESSGAIAGTVAESSEVVSVTVTESSVVTTPEMRAVEVLPPDDSWGGATRGEWDARSWQWVFSMPEDVSPWSDTADERCGYGQFGPVFFLPGGPDRTCVVAEGTAIHVVVSSEECSTVEPPPCFGRTESELLACANSNLDQVTEVQASVNGQNVADLDAYRTTSPLFTITFPEDNVRGVAPGVAHAVSASYSFIIAPPPPGHYEIATSRVFPTGLEDNAFTVIVGAPQVIESPTNDDLKRPASELRRSQACRDASPTERRCGMFGGARLPRPEPCCRRRFGAPMLGMELVGPMEYLRYLRRRRG